MKTTPKKLGIGLAAVAAGSMLLVPALQSSAGSLPDPETVPCEAFGSEHECLSSQARRKLPPRCGLADTSSADNVLLLTDLVAHANLL
jgi:hypothetical protein